MKIQELRELDDKAIQKEHVALLKEQFNLRMQHGTGNSPKPHLYKKFRKQIAQLKTIMHERRGSGKDE